MRLTSILLVLTFVVFSTVGQDLSFKAGAALRIITPDPLIAVSGGVGTPKPVTKKQGDLFVRALVMEKGNERVAIVNIDNLGWPAALGDKSRALIKGIKPENILIGVSHTHSAPDAYGFPDEQGNIGADLKYLEWCIKQIADAVNEATGKLEQADLKVAVAEAKGKIAYNYYAPRLYDPRCGVIQAISKEGKTIATLVNYATHPEIIGSNRGILSPDMCGPLYDRIEKKAGGIALYMNSAQGGMVTADNRLEDGKEASDWAECIRNGNLLADEALRIVSSAKVQENPDLFCTSKIIEFPVDSELMRAILKNSPISSMGSSKENTVATRINLVNIGSAQAITIPGEALPNIGFYLKRKMSTQHPFLFGLTNDAFGYIITKEDFDSFERYKYISKTSLGERTADIYINEVLDLVQNSPSPKEIQD